MLKIMFLITACWLFYLLYKKKEYFNMFLVAVFAVLVIFVSVDGTAFAMKDDDSDNKGLTKEQMIPSNNYLKGNNLNEKKVIIIGDSRMEFLDKDVNVSRPDYYHFIAKGGAKIDWFKNTAISRLYNLLDENIYENYYVVINMGVNDLNNFDNSSLDVGKSYYELYNNIASKYHNVNFYILSINPLDDNLYDRKSPSNQIDNNKIISANRVIKKMIRGSYNDNIEYCDSFNTLSFSTNDGIHYTTKTSQDIINYIENSCIEYSE